MLRRRALAAHALVPPLTRLARGLPRGAAAALPLAIALLGAALFVAAPVEKPAHADFFSQSPGPLSAPHQALDTADQCDKCHTSGRALANDKCLACHQPIARRILQSKGLHASSRVSGKQCFLCHTEHKGRAKDVLGFAAFGGKDKFDHEVTGFSLVGAHVSVRCEKCHTTSKGGHVSYLGASASCAGCHRSPHGELRASLEKCERCHDQSSWRQKPRMEFDHDAPSDSRFPLEAKHAGVPCLRCHDGWKFRAAGSFAPPDCAPCHENVHGDSLFGQPKRRCSLCHSAKVDWSRVRFDHARLARWPLDGAHAGKPCAACHTKSERAKPDKACVTCHHDVHKARFAHLPGGGDCQSCHSTAAWRADVHFDHDTKTRFPLTGKHAEATCRACHRGTSPSEWERFDKLLSGPGGKTVACMGCHQHENVHKRQYPDSRCLECHQAAGKVQFKRQAVTRFHGPSSSFPLSEGHAKVACERCHRNDVFTGTPTACGPACHPDELHQGSLGTDCRRCHEGGHWPATRFDHDQTRYPLVGHHQQAPCEGCHPQRQFAKAPTKCAACHGQDDVHQGTLGKECERCHSPTGRSLFDHNDPSAPGRFRLEGAHAQVRCKACHPTERFAATPRTCDACHGEPDVHKGELGTRCADCHDTVAWSRVRTGHVRGDLRFGGAHDRVRCVACHPGGLRRAGTGELCIACHRRDDVHHGSLGPRCGECHGQESFSGGSVRFFHERVGCALRGVHRTLPCVDCHVGGNFAALSTACVSCHRADAVRAMSDKMAPAGHAGFTTCAGCHNQSYFAPSRPAMTGSESVCQ